MNRKISLLAFLVVISAIPVFSQGVYNFTILALNYSSGLPIQNLVITLDSNILGTYSNITDSNGFAEFTNIPEGTYNITANYNGATCTIYDPQNNDNIMTTLTVDENIDNITIDVNCTQPSGTNGYNLTVYVFDNSTGNPVPDFAVYINGSPLNPYGTNQNGMIYGFLSPGNYVLTLQDNTNFVLESDRNTVLSNHSFSLTSNMVLRIYTVSESSCSSSGSTGSSTGSNYTLGITVLDNSTGSPVPDLAIYINGSSLSPVGTYPNGSLVFELPPGNYVITLGNNLQFVTQEDRNTPVTSYSINLNSDINLTLYVVNYTGSGSGEGFGSEESTEPQLGSCNIGNISVIVSVELDEGMSDDTFLVGAFNDTYGCLTNLTTSNGRGNVTLNLTPGHWYIGVIGNTTGLMNYTWNPLNIVTPPYYYTVHFYRMNTVDGYVTYQGNPVEGYVFLHNENYTIYKMTHTQNGYYSLIGVPNGTFILEFMPDDFSLPNYINDSFEVSGDMEYNISLENVPGIIINGTVTVGGSPIDGFVILLKKQLYEDSYESYSFISATQISSGHYTFYGIEEEPATYRMIIDTNNGIHREYDFNLTQEDIENGYKEFNIELAEGIRIEGYVKTQDGFPVAGCTLFVYNEYEFYSTITDQNGYYSIYGLNNNTLYYIDVRPDIPTPENNFTPSSLTPIFDSVFVESNTVQKNFTLGEGVDLTGSIIGINCSQAPYGCGWISAFSRDGGYGWGEIHSNGSFTIYGLEVNKTYDILFTFAPEVGKPDYWKRNVLVNTSSENSPLTIDLTSYQSATISGRILAEGNPVREADVIIYSETFGSWARTDNNGAFEIRGVPLGENYTIQVIHPDYSEYTGNIFVNSSEIQLPDIILTSGYTLSGYVLDSDNTPISNAEIEIWDENTWKHTTTDQNGYYSIGGLQEGSYTYHVWLPDGRFISGNITISGNTQQNISISTAYNLTISISGPTSGISIDLIGNSYSTSVNLDGTSHTFEDIPEGNYTLIVSASGYETNITSVFLDSNKNVNIALNPLPATTYTVTINIDASSLSNVQAYYVILSGNGQTFYNKSQTQTQFSFDNVPEGNYTLTAMVMSNGVFHENSTSITVNSDRTFTITVE